MKKIMIFMFLLASCLCGTLKAQTTAVIALENRNVLYVGYLNAISVAVPGISSDKITVSVDGGTISGSNGKYVISNLTWPSPNGVTLNVYSGSSLIESRTFRVERIPDPMPYVTRQLIPGHIKMTKKELLDAGQIKIQDFVPLDDLIFTVESYVVSTIVTGGLLKEFPCKGSSFSQNVKDEISKAKAGQKFFFESIVVKGPDGSPRNVLSFFVEIVE